MRLPVLTYHAVLPAQRDASLRGTVPLERFREQIDWLCGRGYEAISLDRAANLLAGRGEQVARPVVLTFDDGYRCVVEHALPVLERAGYTATLFAVTDAVGGTSHWYADGPEFEHAGWDELERARARGFAIGSHGVSHRALAELEPDVARDEVCRSREEIAKRLGACDHFAYPYGSVSDPVVSVVEQAGYRTACTTQRGFNRVRGVRGVRGMGGRGGSLLRLRRQNVGRFVTAARFRRRAGSWW